VVVAGAGASAGVDVEDNKGERNSRFLKSPGGLRKNNNQGRELDEDIDLW